MPSLSRWLNSFHLLTAFLMTGALALPHPANAAAPDVKSLFPPGASAGSEPEVDATGTLAAPGTQLWASHPGLVGTVPDSGSKFSLKVAADVPPGRHWLRFHNADGASGMVPFVIGRLPEVTEVEPNNVFSTSAERRKVQTLEKSCVVNGRLGESGDVDHFRIAVRTGQSLVVAVDSHWRLGSQADVVLQVLGARGEVLEQIDDDHGNDPFVAIEARHDAEWTVRLFAFPASPDSSIRFAGGAGYFYRLTVTTGAYGAFAVPSLKPRGQDPVVQVKGWNLTDLLRQPVPTAGLSVTGLQHADLPDPVPFEEFDGPVLTETAPSSRAAPLELPVPAAVCGGIEQPHESDWFRLRLTRGQKVQLDVESRRHGFPLDAALQVLGSNGNVLAEADDIRGETPDPTLKFTAPSDGEFLIRVRDVFGHGHWRYAYRLLVRPLTPSVALTVTADRLTVKPDAPAEVTVAVDRNDGFADELLISIDGLPEGLVAEPVKSEKSGDSARQVKLIIRADKPAAFQGPVRITGRAGESPPVTATLDLPAYRAQITELWLTAVAPAPEAAPPESR